MKLTRLRGACNDGKTCPTLYASDQGTLVVQGWRTEAAVDVWHSPLPAGEVVVAIPADLAREILGLPAIVADSDRFLVRGRPVRDDETLAQVAPLPASEDVVELDHRALARVSARAV